MPALSYIASLFVALFLIVAGAYDYYFVWHKKLGLGSGHTACWKIYSLSREYPEYPFFFGLISAFVFCFACYPLALAWAILMGHIFIVMRGA